MKKDGLVRPSNSKDVKTAASASANKDDSEKTGEGENAKEGPKDGK